MFYRANSVRVKYDVRVTSDDALPTPPVVPGRRTVRAPHARPPLSRDLVVAKAIEVLDAEGLGAVSMRRVASELGTGAASLYVYVANKDELMELMFDVIAGEMELVPIDPEQWEAQLIGLAEAAVEVMTRHRDIARVMLAHVPTGDNAMRVSEHMLTLLRSAGLPDQVVAWAADMLSLFMSASALERAVAASRGEDEAANQAYWDQLHAWFADLPAGRFPTTVALVPELSTGDAKERFRFGLETFVRGLATYLPPD